MSISVVCQEIVHTRPIHPRVVMFPKQKVDDNEFAFAFTDCVGKQVNIFFRIEECPIDYAEMVNKPVVDAGTHTGNANATATNTMTAAIFKRRDVAEVITPQKS